MPYRRLPNTETARYKALKIALQKGEDLPPYKLPYSQKSLRQLRGFLPEYERQFKQLQEAKNVIIAKSKKYYELQKKAKIYISHFIQIMNFSIIRGELKPIARTFYGLKENDCKIPKINTEIDLIKWGEIMINGEPERIAQGGNPVTNPTIAVVKVRYDQFIDAYRHQNTLRNSYKRLSDKIADMRSEADSIILNIWNEVEVFYNEFPDKEKRDKTKEYGIIYFFRKSEKNRINKTGNKEEVDVLLKNSTKKKRIDSQFSLSLFKD